MISHLNTLFIRLSSKVSYLLQGRQVYIPADKFLITRYSLVLHCERGRKLQSDDANTLYSQGQRSVDTIPAFAAAALTSTNDDSDTKWSWCSIGAE
jgi:hypothetical protein